MIAGAHQSPEMKPTPEPAIHTRPSAAQLVWLKRGLRQPGGKLPLFDEWGQRVNEQTIRSCVAQGWAEPWFANPLKPDWLVCRLTEAGRSLADPH
jgi:hypothetical protein